MQKDFRLLKFLLTAVALGDPVSNLPSIAPAALTEVMNEVTSNGINAYNSFVNLRNTLSDYPNPLSNMRESIRYKMSQFAGQAGGGEKGHILNLSSFETNVLNSNGNPNRVTGINFILTLSQNSTDTTKDTPLVIVANYDTDFKAGANPVEDNGSGLAALLVIGDRITRDISENKYTLKNSIILAAVDISFRKYDSHAQGAANNNDETGADNFARKFLPIYLRDRSTPRGIIVLDSLMNYDDTPRSQETQGMDRAYRDSYQQISEGQFAGNFLALVARGGGIDQNLIEAFEEGWRKSKKQNRDLTPSQSPPEYADPRLIQFIHNPENEGNQAYLHFLKSDQASFWNHHTIRVGPTWPAILLTDTREYRNSTCKSIRCTSDQMYREATKEKNLQFAHRTTVAVYETIVKLQSGGLNIQGSTFLYLVAVVGVLYHYFL